MPNDIYLSSTLNDLQDERAAARDVLGRQGYGIKDSYQASEQDLIASCLDDVAKCAIYVCIVGMRYGYRPAHTVANPDDESITRLEFKEAQRLNLPCFVFVKSDAAAYKPAHLDSHTHENDNGDRIKAFRDWVATQAEVRPTQFETIQELREKLLAAVLHYEHRKAGVPASILRSDTRHRAELVADIGLVLHPAADEHVYSLYRQHLRPQSNDKRFKLLELAPDDAQYLAKVDDLARDCRTVCWLLTPTVLQSYEDQAGLLSQAIRQQRRRRGDVGALLAGGATIASLPAEWNFGAAIEADPLVTVALDDIYQALRARVRTIRLDRRIGLPCLVFAMTKAEAAELAAIDGSLMTSIGDVTERTLRKGQVAQMLSAIRLPAVQPAWPDQSYGGEREDWRPFGPASPTAREYLQQAVDRLNDGEPSKRERLFMKGGGDDRLRLQLMPYALDELIDDMRGSRASVLSARDRGCIVLIDELALLHPALRPWAKTLLKGENVAVLSSHPADPAPYPVSAALAQDSSLQVGSLMTRFRDEHDPRCEVAINSPQRLQRWLRLVLPELVPTLGGEEAQSTLVNKSDEELFGRKVPA
jgi:hypothetical protein